MGLNNKKILTKAIQKAIDGGWYNDYGWKVFNGDLANLDQDHVWAGGLLFNHEFAKALWPTDGFTKYTIEAYKGSPNRSPHKEYDRLTTRAIKGSWQYHLQNMVISDDPIAYLGEHLDD